MDELLIIENASKKYKNNTIFENVSLTINRGKSYGFVGENGCGKSVFFKTICGYSMLTDGEVIYDGKVIGKDTDFIYDAGVVIEQPEFIGNLSGWENLKILADIQKKITDDEISEMLKRVKLYDEKDKKVKKYSVGMKQKLRIAQAFMEKPQIVILDEPFNGLDKKSVQVAEELLHEYVNNGGTLLLTSHIEEQIKNNCCVVYEFEDKNIVEIN
jgi:ABC-2 type transport system ATP-binding protein